MWLEVPLARDIELTLPISLPPVQSSRAIVSRRAFLLGSAAMTLAMATEVRAGGFPTSDAPFLLWYRKPAEQWEQALPVGNGRIGAMVFGGLHEERLQLNEDTLWSGGPYDPVNPEAREALPEVRRLIAQRDFARAQALADDRVMARPLSQMAYQVLGNLTLTMPDLGQPQSDSYRRELDIDAAMASTHFVAGGVRYRRDVIASPDHQVIAVHLSADRASRISCNVAIDTPHAAKLAVTDGELLLVGRNGGAHGIAGALTFAARVRVIPHGGTLSNGPQAVHVAAADAVTILIAMATSYRRFDDVSGDPLGRTQAQIAAAAPLDFARLARDTAASHRRLFRRVTCDLGPALTAGLPTDERIAANQLRHDSGLAALYFNYGRYLLIASSRPGSQPANLQGIWNEHTDPPWGSKYTININTEMNYWPAHATALSECAEPLVELIRDLATTGTRTAREMYGARGWVAHHNTDLWRATAPIDGAQWGLWPTGGAWLCTHLWDFYDYTRDIDFLRSVYPLMRGAALFFLDTLQTDGVTGHLVTSPSISPETPIQTAHRYVPGRRRISRSCGTCSRKPPVPPACWIPMRILQRSSSRCANGSRRTGSARKGNCRNGSRTGTRSRRSRNIGTCPISMRCSRATRSIRTTPPPSPRQHASRWKCAATNPQDGPRRGASRCGRGCAKASTRIRSCSSCSARAGPIQTCSMRIRRSR